MKKKKLELDDDHQQHELEIVKAVAQAWYGHSGSSRTTTNEFDAYRRNFKSQPSRFKLEAMNYKLPAKDTANNANWDFRESLLDSYEIVTVSKKLEAGLTLDNPFSGLDDQSRARSRRREKEHRRVFGCMRALLVPKRKLPGVYY
ncbi:hypothetical protein ACOSQ3_025667 [Xanthoceras sorbifolium]